MERAVVEPAPFREDLYYRLNVFTITPAALRERPSDIPGAGRVLPGEVRAPSTGASISRVSSGAIDVLMRGHAWPGNVRELENVIERAVVVCDGFVIQERHLPDSIKSPAEKRPTNRSLGEAVARLERSMISEALAKDAGQRGARGAELGTTERIVRYKAQKYGIFTTRQRG